MRRWTARSTRPWRMSWPQARQRRAPPRPSFARSVACRTSRRAGIPRVALRRNEPVLRARKACAPSLRSAIRLGNHRAIDIERDKRDIRSHVGQPIGPGEAARRLGVSTRTVQRWLREGRLPSVAVGERVKVDASAFTPSEERVAAPAARHIERLLVANRGELVVRIARTARRLGITTLALVPEDQARAWWARAADEIVPLRGSYLDID